MEKFTVFLKEMMVNYVNTFAEPAVSVIMG